MIYFDNSATTKPCTEVSSIIAYNLTSDELFANPGSIHKLGILSENKYQETLKACSKLLGGKEKDFYFTSCGTEGTNTALLGYMRSNKHIGRTIVSTRTEHKATLETLRLLKDEGFNIIYVDVNSDGVINYEKLSEVISDDTALIALTHVNNETGATIDIKRINEIRRKYPRIVLFVDYVQSLGKLPINLLSDKVDMATFSGHKIHGIKGVGLLYVRTGIRINPLIVGGGQQNNLRSGTKSLLLAQSFEMALRTALNTIDESYNNISKINSYLRTELIERGATINSPQDACPYILNVSFKDFQSETMLHCLEENDIYVSTVSACSSKSKKPSYVLLEMGVRRETAINSVRLSFSRYNTMEEAKEFIKAIDLIYDKYSVKRG